jgi:transposase
MPNVKPLQVARRCFAASRACRFWRWRRYGDALDGLEPSSSIAREVSSKLRRVPAHVHLGKFHRKAWPFVPAALKPALVPIFRVLDQLEERVDAFDEQIKQLAKQDPDVEVIAQPKGVGILTALVFLLTLEDKARFSKSRTVGAFIGFNPKRDQSGDCDKQLGITKTGDAFTRRLAVGSANYILGPFGQDSELRRWGLELAKRGGRNAKKRATVAVARKLVVLMHRLWVTGEVYQPLGYRARRATAA